MEAERIYNFPHHENELCQSKACGYENLASIWMHNNVLKVNNNKMSKSENNFIYLKDLVSDKYKADIFRYFILNSHYKKEIEFNEELFLECEKALSNIRKFYFKYIFNKEIELVDRDNEFLLDLYEDLNSPKIIQNLHNLISSKKEENISVIKTIIEILGFHMKPLSRLTAFKVDTILKLRAKFKLQKNIESADKIRQGLVNDFVEVRDLQDGSTEWNFI